MILLETSVACSPSKRTRDLMNPEPFQPLSVNHFRTSPRLSFGSKFLWFFLLPHVIVIPVVWMSSVSIFSATSRGGLGQLFDILGRYFTLGEIPIRVFLPIALLSFCLTFLPWKTRAMAFVCGLLLLLVADGGGAVYFLSTPYEFDTRIRH